jgi:hypothetical protein
MANTLKVLGQVVPTANSLTALYTVPAATSTVASSLFICNQNAAYGNIAYINVSLAVGGAADAAAQYIYHQLPIGGGNTFVATAGIALATGDVVRVLSTEANVSFNLTGTEAT